MESDIEGARNLKLVLGAFEKLSDLKINIHKSELFSSGTARATESGVRRAFWEQGR